MVNKTDLVLRGRKGGSDPPPPPVNTPDNLRSVDSFEAILGISEGPIEGLADGNKSFFLGGTPMENAQGQGNFSDISLIIHRGDDPANPIVPVLGGIVSKSTSVNIQLASGIPIVRPTSLPLLNILEVRMLVTRLLRSDETGTYTSSVQFNIEYKAESASTWKSFSSTGVLTISGKTTSPYVKEYRRTVPVLTDENYEIRVTKISPEDTSEVFRGISWESFQEVIPGSRSYDGTAVAQVYGRSTNQFTSIPEFKGVFKGLTVRVPSNYDPVTRTYDGIWAGFWKIAYTNNPAWILYDFVTNDRYGLRSYSDVRMDKFDAYEAAVWCDELVDDGIGGTQPRYTFNDYIQEARPGKELARYIAGAFNGVIFDDLNGCIKLRVDKEEQAIAMFTPENVGEAGFEYSYTDLGSRYNDITVSFKNPNLNWEIDRRRVHDQVLIDQFGRIPLDFIAVGCTDVHEAFRRANYKLITATTEKEFVTFSTNRRGQFLEPFEIILVADPDMGYAISGRVQSLSGDRVTVLLRDPIFLEAGVTYTAKFQLAGSIHEVDLIPLSGEVTGFNVVTALPASVLVDTVFSLESNGSAGLPKAYRVLNISESGGDVDAITVHALEINRLKWGLVDDVSGFDESIDWSALDQSLSPPGPISLGFHEAFDSAAKQFQLIVNPVFDRDLYSYYSGAFQVWSRLHGSEDGYIQRELVDNDTILNHPVGIHDFKVLGVSILNTVTNIDSVDETVFSVTDPFSPPPDVRSGAIVGPDVTWLYPTEPLDFAGYEVRYHITANKTTWEDALRAHDGYLSEKTIPLNQIPDETQTILIKAVDWQGVYSTFAFVIQQALTPIETSNIVMQRDFHTELFPGYIVNGTESGGDLISVAKDDSVYTTNVSNFMYTAENFYGGEFEALEYHPVFTVPQFSSLKLDSIISGLGFTTYYRILEDDTLVYDNTNFYEDEHVYEQTTWVLYGIPPSLNVGRHQIKLIDKDGTIPGTISVLSVIMDATIIIEEFYDQAIAASTGTRLPITETYNTIQSVSLTLVNGGGSAAYAQVMDKDPVLGPLIKTFNNGGSAVSGKVDAIVKGF